MKQSLLCAYACEQRRNVEKREQHPDCRPKGQPPSERATEQSQIAGIANDSVDPGRHQLVPGLDRDQPAKPPSERDDRPKAERPACNEQRNAEPTDVVSVESPEPDLSV